MTLLLAGATGLIGQAVMAQWAALAPGQTLHALVRRPLAAVPAGVQPQVVDFSALPALPQAEAALCALGTTIKTAGSQAGFRAVDFDAVLAFARAAQAAGVRRFAVVSAVGASARSASFYSRVKGEMEEAVTTLGFETLLIARPSLLLGDREALGQPARRAEGLAQTLLTPLGTLVPAAWRPIAGATVARALLQALVHPDTTPPATRGVQICDNARLHAAGSPPGRSP